MPAKKKTTPKKKPALKKKAAPKKKKARKKKAAPKKKGTRKKKVTPQKKTTRKKKASTQKAATKKKTKPRRLTVLRRWAKSSKITKSKKRAKFRAKYTLREEPKKIPPEAKLVEIFMRNGCVRVPNLDRREKEPHDYKKGYEIRLAADTKRELADIRRLLKRSGIKRARAYQKNNQWIQPIYGNQTLEQFCGWLREYT